jgi:hypothetical protein
MRRRIAGERVALFDTEEAERLAEPIRKDIEGWAKMATLFLQNVRHGYVEGFDGRQNDTVRPLLTIGLGAGRDWFTRLLAALRLALKSNAESTESIGTMLLKDMRECFDDKRRDRLSTVDALEYLHQLDERPWQSWGYRHEPMKPHQLAKELGKYRIAVRKIRVGDRTSKGYMRADFEDALRRLCSVAASPEAEGHSDGMTDI